MQAPGVTRDLKRLGLTDYVQRLVDSLEETAGDKDVPKPPAPRTSSSGLIEELSSRELEILKLVGKGFSNHDIGEELFISSGTVKWHVSNIFGKLGVGKRTRAVAVARELGLIKE